MRQLAPELLLTARTQWWAPEELLRTSDRTEISARDASNARTRMKAVAFPVTTLEEFDLSVSAVPKAAFTYLASLEWIRARENLCLVGPGGTGESHPLVVLGIASHWPFESWGRFLPSTQPPLACWTGCCITRNVVVTDGDSYRMARPGPKEEPP